MAGQIVKRSDSSFTVRIFMGRDPETGKRNYLNRTPRYCHTVFNNAPQQAVKWRMTSHNPARYVDLPKQQKKEMLALSREEANRFLEAAASSKHHVLFATLLGTGLRPSEALGLQWGDIDFATNTLQVQRVVALHKGGWSFKPPKTSRSRRSIPYRKTSPGNCSSTENGRNPTSSSWSSQTKRACP